MEIGLHNRHAFMGVVLVPVVGLVLILAAALFAVQSCLALRIRVQVQVLLLTVVIFLIVLA